MRRVAASIDVRARDAGEGGGGETRGWGETGARAVGRDERARRLTAQFLNLASSSASFGQQRVQHEENASTRGRMRE